MTAFFVVSVWQYQVLMRPDVVKLFNKQNVGSEAKPLTVEELPTRKSFRQRYQENYHNRHS